MLTVKQPMKSYIFQPNLFFKKNNNNNVLPIYFMLMGSKEDFIHMQKYTVTYHCKGTQNFTQQFTLIALKLVCQTD